MKENKLRKYLNEGKPLISTRLWSTDPVFYEAVGQTGQFEYVEFVAEYAPYDFKDFPNIARACELNDMGSMIKVDFQGRALVAQKAVQAGFQSIMFVDHRTPEQVEESVNLMKPLIPGSTGVFGYPNARYIGNQSHIATPDHVKRLQDIVLCFMIEKADAVDSIDEICSIPGVDMIQFGPGDFSMSKGWNRAEKAAELKKIEEHLIEVAIKHGVRPRAEIVNPADAAWYLERGVKDISLGDQMAKLKAFWNGQGKELRGMVGC